MPAAVEAAAPIVTPAILRFDGKHSYVERDILDDIKSGVAGVEASFKSVFGTALPSFFTEGTTSVHQAGPSRMLD